MHNLLKAFENYSLIYSKSNLHMRDCMIMSSTKNHTVMWPKLSKRFRFQYKLIIKYPR